jgi:FMN-dependent NADH-azoreductase
MSEILRALEFNGETGEIVERELTAEDIAELEAIQAEALTRQAEAEAKAAARASALAKLADLGLTEEEVAAL